MLRPKTRPKETGDSPGVDDAGPVPSWRSWQAPPDGLFDVIVPQLTAKQFVVVQLVCKDWSRSARYCLKEAAPKRPDVDLTSLVAHYPNLTQLNLSYLEGWTTSMLTPLRQLTALRELCVSNIALQHKNATLEGGAGDAAGHKRRSAVGPQGSDAVEVAAVPRKARSGRPSGAQSPLPPRTRSRARAAAVGGAADGAVVSGGDGGSGARGRSPVSPQGLPPLPARVSSGQGHRKAGPSINKPSAAAAAGLPIKAYVAVAPEAGAAAVPLAPPHTDGHLRCGHQGDDLGAAAETRAQAGEDMGGAWAAGGGECQGPGAAAAVLEASSPSPPLSPASRIFGGLGDVLLRLTKLQADLCPALTAESIAALPSLTDLTLDTLITPAALAPLGRLRSLAVKKLANQEHLDKLIGLTALLVNSDSSCASEFLPVCTRLPNLQSLTFKTSSTKVLPGGDALCWHGFSRLTSLDLRVPVEVVKPGLPALAELGGLSSLALDLYCASDEELMVTVVAPPNLASLFVSSDRSRSGGVIDVHPNARLRSLRLRLYWTALNLVLPEGLPEPSPLPEPLSEDLMDTEDMVGPSPASLARQLDADLAAAAAGGEQAGPAEGATPGGSRGAGPSGTPGTGGHGGRGRRRRLSGVSASPGEDVAAVGAAAAAGASPGRGQRRRLSRGKTADDGGAGAEAGRDATVGGYAGPSGAVTGAGAAGGAAAAPAPARREEGEIAAADAEREDADSVERRPGSAHAGGAASQPHGSPQRCRRTPSRHSTGAAASPLRNAAPAVTPSAGTPTLCGLAQRRGSGASAGAAAGGDATMPVASRRGAGGATPGASTTTAAGDGAACSPQQQQQQQQQAAAAAALPDLALEELCLDACFFLLYGSLVPLLRQFPRLRSLTLDNSLALENGELAQLCELTQLRELSVSAVHLLTDAGLRSLGRLSALTSLRLRGLRKMSMHAAQSYMRQKPIVRRYEDVSGSFLTALAPLADLRCLALKHLHTAGEAQLAAGLRNLTQLTRLEVKDVHSMSDTVLASLGRHTRLRELSVLHCEAVTHRGRTCVVRSLGQRLALDFEGCSLPDITRPCALPTTSTQAQLIDDDQTSSSNRPRRSCQHSNQH